MSKLDIESTLSDRPLPRDRVTDLASEVSLAMVLLGGKDGDSITFPGCTKVAVQLKGVKELLFNWKKLTPTEFAKLPPNVQNRLTLKLGRMIEDNFKKQFPDRFKEACDRVLSPEQYAAQKERGRLHYQLLVPWSRGELRLEKPHGSSLHHLIAYDKGSTPVGSFSQHFVSGDLQLMVVEHDWGRAVPPVQVGDEWLMPFPYSCWEFRISGIRVLTFVEIFNDEPVMLSVFGIEGHWICDDYLYRVSNGKLVSEVADRANNKCAIEFRRVAEMVYREIRACCIMLDASVGFCEKVPASPKLVERCKSEKKPAPRAYSVIRLFRKHTQRRVVRSNGAHVSVGARAPQRGHWRRGNYFHYDDPDSGQVQYINDGGFWVSKTWRKFYFAGDPNNIIEREYRL
jgi:hypothetical protein